MCGQENEDRFARSKEWMLKRDLKGRDITDPGVLRVMAEIPREEFVAEAYLSQAYSDGPLPIGMGQTISQPYIVALMTQELRVTCDCEVLEVGTGSGYQTAVLSRLAKKVYTIEKFSQLSESAQAVLGRLGASNVVFCIGDGSCGWLESSLCGGPQSGRFDRIMITAAVPKIPEPLVEQLAQGGLIVGPVGCGAVQELMVGRKREGDIIETVICSCRFVKLLGKYGFEE
jgi:protein-L-isoaspartate(D-aspartate) O-methyltransferase